MAILAVNNLNHGFGGRKILENVNFKLLKGEHIGFVGANGEGKSTFLNIVTGTLMPDSGDVNWCNRITRGYLDQASTLTRGKTIREVLREAFADMFTMEKEMLSLYENMSDADDDKMQKMMEDASDIGEILESSGFYTLDVKIDEYSNGLGLRDIGLEKDVSELSGGQRAKVLLTKLLLQNPMILILDEPTNYLDENHINWLKKFLKDYENAFILVSHDIPFLSEVTNVIYHIEEAILTRYSGNYDYFRQMHELKQRQVEIAYNKQQKEIAGLEDFIARNKANVATSNMAKSRQKKLDKLDVIELKREKIKPKFSFKADRTTGKIVIEAKNLVIGYDAPLTKAMDLIVERNQKIAIKGVNGLGKSTLLKSLLKINKSLSGEIEHDQFVNIGYFEQEDQYSDKTAMEEVWDDFPSMSNGEVRSALARAGLTSEHITSKVRVLSGGEQAKVRLCKLMLRSYNVLVLDEPTNHLDIEAKEELKKALIEFKGTIILVSHEPEFYNDIVSHHWNLEDMTNKENF